MKRREFLVNSIFGAGAMCASLPNFSAGIDIAGRESPNFLVITCDDAGWGDFGYHGSEIRTPNLDRLAATGAELDRFYAYPVCSPTRASFMTGKPPSRSGFIEAIGFETEQTLRRDTITIAEMLRKQGYDTALTGKWHLGNTPDRGPNTFGFNHSYGHLTAWVDFYTHRSHDNMRSWHRNGRYIHEEGHATDLIADEAIHFLKELRDKTKPFFLVVHFNAPHLPLQEEEWRVAQYRDSIEFESRRYYAAMVTHVDESIGRILSTLHGEELDGNTLVTFFSDNGGEPPGKRNYLRPVPEFKSTHSTEMYGNNLPYRGWKYELYEGGIHVPAIMHWPGRVAPQKVHQPVIVYDIMPTLGCLAGVDVKDGMDLEGINIWPALSGDSIPEERVLYWRKSNQIAVRKGDWKLIHLSGRPDEGDDELYNLAEDPYETRNRKTDYPQKAAELKKDLLDQYALDRAP